MSPKAELPAPLRVSTRRRFATGSNSHMRHLGVVVHGRNTSAQGGSICKEAQLAKEPGGSTPASARAI